MTSIEPPSGFDHAGSERAYLDAFRDANAMPDAARERVWARLSGGPVGPIGGEAANDAGPMLAAVSGGGRAWLGRSGLLFGAAVAVVTGAIVLALHSAERADLELAPRPVELVVAAPADDRGAVPVEIEIEEIPEIAPIASSSESQTAKSPEPEPPIAKPSRKRARAKPTTTITTTTQTSSLADERRLIEQTHAALGKGDVELALSLLRRHAAMFEAGVFVEEREALLAISTCTAGRLEQGRRAALSFLADYPQAVLAARVRSSCALGD